jgi:hypothetical protein
MGMDRGIFFKDNANARVRPQPDDRVAPRAKRERPRFGPRFKVLENNLRTVVELAPDGYGPPVGAVDLRAVGYTDAEHWEKGVRIMDLVASIQASEAFTLEVMREAFAKPVHAVEDQVAALAERLTAMEAENVALRGSVAEARGEIAAILELQEDLAIRVARARRGGDGAQLPTLTAVKPKIRPKVTPAKRKRAAEGERAA